LSLRTFNQSETSHCPIVEGSRGRPRREDFFSLSEKITFHSKCLLCSLRLNFQDGNISLSEQRITFWNLKLKRRHSKKSLKKSANEIRALRVEKTYFQDELLFWKSKGQSSISKDFSCCELALLALLWVYGRVNYMFDCKFVQKI